MGQPFCGRNESGKAKFSGGAPPDEAEEEEREEQRDFVSPRKLIGSLVTRHIEPSFRQASEYHKTLIQKERGAGEPEA